MPKKEVRRNDRYVHFAWAAVGRGAADAGMPNPITRPVAGRAYRRDHRLGHRRHQHHDPRRDRGARPGRRAHRAIPGHRPHPGHGRGLRCDLRQRPRSELRDRERLQQQQPRHRRRAEHHPAWRRGRDDRRRRRSGDRRDSGRRLRRHARPLDQRNDEPTEGVAAVRRRARRLRDGRWRRACSCSRRSTTRWRAGRRIHAELVGYAATDDASHITLPAPGGRGAVGVHEPGPGRCGPDDRRRSTTSTPTAPAPRPNDQAETAAIKTVFGERRLQASRSAAPRA